MSKKSVLFLTFLLAIALSVAINVEAVQPEYPTKDKGKENGIFKYSVKTGKVYDGLYITRTSVKNTAETGWFLVYYRGSMSTAPLQTLYPGETYTYDLEIFEATPPSYTVVDIEVEWFRPGQPKLSYLVTVELSVSDKYLN